LLNNQKESGLDIQGVFDGLIASAPYRIAADMIERKLSEHGVTLTDKEHEALADQLRTGKVKSVRRQGWKFWDRKNVTIGVSDEDIKEIEQRVKKFHDMIPELGVDLIESISPKLADLVKNGWYKDGSRRQRRFANEAAREIWDVWQEPLELLSLVVDLACRSVENVSYLAHQEETEQPHVREASVRLHARGVRIAKEVPVLLKNGFADAAGARWRTLHETTVIAFFISEHGEECAERYFAHDAVQLYRASRAYMQCCKKLGYDPIPESELAMLENEHREVQEKYGKDFCRDFGWAVSYFDKDRVSFSDLESSVDFGEMRFDYKQASQEVHAGVRSLLAQLGLVEEDTLLGGPSLHGLSTAGSLTARSLVLLTATCIQVWPVMDALVSNYIMMLIGAEAQEKFLAIEDELESQSVNTELL
jgi:hypothetical protein